LTEGVTPAGTALSVTDVTATVLYYGDYVTLTDKLIVETYDPILTETAEILGEQAGDSLDRLCRDVVAAGTTIQYASVAVANGGITSAMKFTRDEAKQAVRTLRGNNAKPVTSMIDPNTGYNTVPIGKSFVAICSEDTAFDLDDATGWIPLEKYPSKTGVMPDEIGALANIRFVMTTNAYVASGEGAGGVDVHYTLVFGQNAYAQSRISGQALKNIVKPLGSAGTADPLDQRSTSGWKAAYVAKILEQGYLVVVRHGVSA
jgi:N4-gp56 family major capsid protein